MIDTSFLHHLDRMDLIIKRKINSNYQGERKSNEVGQGLVIQDYIQYTPGDDFRKIDWKVFARTDKLFIKRFEEERNLTVHIIIDFSASMGFGKNIKKSDFASQVGVGFAYMALKNNERFVLSTFADKLELFQPRRGRKQLAAIVEYLNAKKPSGVSNFSEAVSRYYKSQVKSRSLVVIVSDFLYGLDKIKEAIYRYHEHEVILVQILDEIETDLNIDGDFKLTDSETKSIMRTNVNPQLRKRYLEGMADHQARIGKIAEEIGGKFFTVSTKEQVFDAFYRILSAS